MRVEEVFVPVGAVFAVDLLHVQTHDCGEELGEGEDEEPRKWSRCVCRGFALVFGEFRELGFFVSSSGR